MYREEAIFFTDIWLEEDFSADVLAEWDHARELLYSNSAAIPWWLQSTSVQNNVPSC